MRTFATNWVRCLVLIGLFLYGSNLPLRAAEKGSEVRHLVQMPLAVDKLRKAGVSKSSLSSMVESLNEAGVSPRDVNLFLYTMPLFAEDLGSLVAVSNYTVMQFERGLSGDKLANTLKRELRSRGVMRDLVYPTDVQFVSERMKKIIRTVKRRRLERRRREEPPPEPDEPRQGPNQPSPAPTAPTGPGQPSQYP